MSAHSLLNSVFSCSSAPAAPAGSASPPSSSSSSSSKSLSKRRLRQTRSLDPAVIGRSGGEEASASAESCWRAPRPRAAAPPSAECLAAFSSRALLRPVVPPLPGAAASLSTPSTPLEKSPSGSFHFDYESPRGGKRHTAWELPFLARAPSASALSSAPGGGGGGGANSIFFSPRKWLQQRKGAPGPSGSGSRSSHGAAYVVWKNEVGPPEAPSSFPPAARALLRQSARWHPFGGRLGRVCGHPGGPACLPA
ncbi:hypothetical protein JRQ81_019125 [Phrynocephalus forsythii]|uniref:Uncharacterized protein n=1 Tax=Phrynocephalus forsythii TaxID=171643 RepID=A0A9Q1AXP3_9SAUR|nr:hypothetical protein JRQ81_019125 [Phrynocephalus forsythii]